MNLLYGEFLVSAVLLAIVFAYFPKTPPLPPTASATTVRLNLQYNLKKLIRNRNFWIVALGFGVTAAIPGNWLTVIGPATEPFGFSQAQSGQMATVGTLIGSILSLFMARLVDLLGGHIKVCLVIMWIVGCLNYVWYTILFLEVITPTLAMVYPSVIITGIIAYSGNPLYMELSVELTYPNNEGVVGTVLLTVMNAIGSVFLALFLIPDIGVSWMNWCLIGSAVLGIVLACIQKEAYNRLDFDKAEKANSVDGIS